MIPWFILFSRLRMVDTYTSMILMLGGCPYHLVTPSLKSARGAEQAAMIDGAAARAFFRVLLPNRRGDYQHPFVHLFLNNFMFGVVLTVKTKTLPNSCSTSWPIQKSTKGLMAAAVTLR